ncbi:hypothetical protein HID58_007480 [Brassica napus]|uniref:BnaAnng11420D protein n=3 Tax=Brassica TaxID=3705 RepID=A0A078IN41_BRANA|nr:hypothetical protein HID58_007480 [Brassica napus]CAF2144300.1 unnamed protein product [Brassica napus]CAG7895726.1 unnamed protein product [Brassica rapa]CDY52495.1 BnaAnng11420D [Brassica napus]VDC92441.1 unnamed protein product [Brassica rapa]
MVLTDAEILEIKSELERVKKTSELDEEHMKDLEEKMTEYLEKEKLVGSLLNAVLKMTNNSVAKKQASSSPSMPSASGDKGKQK